MEELIYDRTQEDVNYALNNPDSSTFLKGTYNYTDLNRIEGWCEYLAQELNLHSYSVSIQTKTDWAMEDFPTKDEMKRIRDNVANLKNAFMSITTVPTTLDRMTYSKANDIERILNEIYIFLNNMIANFYYSNEIFSGEV